MPQPARDMTAGRASLDLRRKARAEGRGTNELLVLSIMERLLYRLSISPYRDRFVLKGGMLLAAFDERRPTRDVDLLGLAITNDAMEVDDGIAFRFDQVASLHHPSRTRCRRSRHAGGGDRRRPRVRRPPTGRHGRSWNLLGLNDSAVVEMTTRELCLDSVHRRSRPGSSSADRRGTSPGAPPLRGRCCRPTAVPRPGSWVPE